MNKFVCVRVIQANAMDLSLFQFDYDMSFGVTFLNADRTVYGRYGSRQGKGEESDDVISLEGLGEAMKGALSLHTNYPNNRESLAGKQPRKVALATPEEHPLLSKYQAELDYQGKIAASCIHCHQVRDVQVRALREEGGLLPRKLLTPYPMPSEFGVEMDPKSRATVLAVQSDSPADRAGLKRGDVIVTMQGQPILSLADIQWVLHHTTAPATLQLQIRRGPRGREISIPLASGWDCSADIAWRVSTWDLRRMAFGGMYLVRLADGERAAHGIAPGKMALFAQHVGEYGEHAVAKGAGLRKGDVITSFDGEDADLSESALLRMILGKHRRGETVTFTYRRDGKSHTASIRLQ